MESKPFVKQISLYAGLAVVMFIAIVFLDNPRTQNIIWAGTYTSGAANFEFGKGWRFNEADITLLQGLSKSERIAHRLEPSDPEDLLAWNGTTKGYLYVVLAARTLFPWMGDLNAVETLQRVTHILVTLSILSMLGSTSRKIVFLLGYGLNPLVVHIVTFPYYYYWQTIPTALIAAYLLNRKLEYGRWIWLIAVVLAVTYLVRPTTLFVSAMVFFLVFLRESKVRAVAALACFLVLAMPVFGGNDHRKDPWHTAYTAIGAYPNPYGLEFSDHDGTRLYEKTTGRKIKHGVGGDFYHNPEFQIEYAAIEKREFLRILKESPFMLLRNAVLNFLQSFAFGYLNPSMFLSYVSSAVGLVVIGVLLAKRRFMFAFSIAVSSAAYVLICPPVHVYGFGSYVLLVGATVDLLRDYPQLDDWPSLARKLRLPAALGAG